jgi:hypothetical protein
LIGRTIHSWHHLAREKSLVAAVVRRENIEWKLVLEEGHVDLQEKLVSRLEKERMEASTAASHWTLVSSRGAHDDAKGLVT